MLSVIGHYLTLSHLAHYVLGAGLTALGLWLYLKFRGDNLTPLTFGVLVFAWPISWCFLWYLRKHESDGLEPPMRDPPKRR